METKPPQSSNEPKPRPQNTENPALRMMGLPKIRATLPSRNWLIFWSTLGSFTAAVIYDRHKKRKVQQKWCNTVAYIADESLPTQQMPRRITVLLQAPPGDYITSAREHFNEYVKPILVAAAVDWDVIEGKKEDDIRYKVADRIRTERGKVHHQTQTSASDLSVKHAAVIMKEGGGMRKSQDRGGDLVLGRHAWKEYVRGFHEGWLGPLEFQEKTSKIDSGESTLPAKTADGQGLQSNIPSDGLNSLESLDATSSIEQSNRDSSKLTSPHEEPSQSSSSSTAKNPRSPHILPREYASGSLPVSIAPAFEPSVAVPFPHLLGFMNTPFRVWRFLNKRSVAEETGAIVAAFLVAPQSAVRAFRHPSYNIVDERESRPTDERQGDNDEQEYSESGELQSLLMDEERDWHKSATSPKAEGEADARPWQEAVIVDERIGCRMRTIDKLDKGQAHSLFKMTSRQLRTPTLDMSLSVGLQQENPRGVDWKGSADRREVKTWRERFQSLLPFQKGEQVHRPWQQGMQDEDDS